MGLFYIINQRKLATKLAENSEFVVILCNNKLFIVFKKVIFWLNFENILTKFWKKIFDPFFQFDEILKTFSK